MAETRTIQTIKQPYKTSDGTTLYMGTSTVVEVDANGKYIPNSAVVSLRLYDTTSSLLGTDYKTVAIRNAGEAWNFTKDGNSNYVAGSDLRKTLTNKNSMMNINLNNHVSGVLSAPLQGVPAGQVNSNTQSSSSAALGGSSLGGKPDDPEDSLNPISVNIKSQNTRTEYGNYYYPEALRGNPKGSSSKQDRIVFTMKSVSSVKLDPTLGNKNITRNYDRIEGSVTLPIQPSISDSNNVEWQGLTMNALEAYAAASSVNLMSKDNISGLFAGAAQGIQKAAEALFSSGAAGDYQTAIKLAIAQEAVGINGLLSRASGAILNPNMELLFNGPSLRNFNYAFRLSPRTASEAEQVRKIIRFFKQGMSVKNTASEVFLKSPNVFDIRYVSYDNDGNKIEDHPSLTRIKTCALLGCDVDYTPDGTYMTYNDSKRSMTSYNLSLRFGELEPIYERDYNEIDGITFNKEGDKTINPSSFDSAGIGY